MIKKISMMFIIVLAVAGSLNSESLKGMSLNGSTGLIGIPSGRIGWEESTNFGFDLGYHAVFDNDITVQIPKATVSFLKIGEIGYCYDSQDDSDNADMIFHAKLQLPIKGESAVALGGNFQHLNQADEESSITQIYLAATYPGEFFNMHAETTAVIGKRFGENAPDSAIDFGMGFDLNLFPKTFQGYIHWINDFSNFSYQSQAYFGSNADSRGAFNTGVRINFASIPELSKFKFAIDAIITDALDENRAFCMGIVFGMPLGN